MGINYSKLQYFINLPIDDKYKPFKHFFDPLVEGHARSDYIGNSNAKQTRTITNEELRKQIAIALNITFGYDYRRNMSAASRSLSFSGTIEIQMIRHKEYHIYILFRTTNIKII